MMCNDERKKDMLRAYELAAKLWIDTDQHFWSVYNIMIVANSILIASAGWLFGLESGVQDSFEEFLTFLSFYAIPFLGIVLCFFWLIMTIRAAKFRRHYAFAARRMEEKLQDIYNLPDVYNILSGGNQLFKGENLELKLRNETENIKMPYIARLFRDTISSYIIIGLFWAVHLVILLGRNYEEIGQFFGIIY